MAFIEKCFCSPWEEAVHGLQREYFCSPWEEVVYGFNREMLLFTLGGGHLWPSLRNAFVHLGRRSFTASMGNVILSTFLKATFEFSPY